MSTALSARPPIPISRAGPNLPSRIIYHGVEGIGKSSWAAQSPKPIFIMTRGETGLATLIDNGQIGETDHFAVISNWMDMLGCIDYLAINDTGHKTLCLDTLNGAERLCFEHVCKEQFSGSMDNFLAYGKGPEIAQAEWIKLLSALDFVREERRMMVIALCHTKVKTFKNPEGNDYDRYTPDMHDKIWGLSHKWADVVLFGNYETFADKKKNENKAKAVSAGRRLFFTQRRAAFDAKNRLGLPAEIEMGESHQAAWQAFASAAKAAKAKTQQPEGEKS